MAVISRLFRFRPSRICWLVPIAVLFYVAWMNLLPAGGTVTHFIDVGGDESEGAKDLSGIESGLALTSIDRMSEPVITEDADYRELQHDLVYFTLDDRLLSAADSVEVSVRFLDRFPENTGLELGAKNSEEWGFESQEVYVPHYRQLEGLPVVAQNGNGTIKVYALDREGSDCTDAIERLLEPEFASVVAQYPQGLGIDDSCEAVWVDPDEGWAGQGIDYLIIHTGEYVPPARDDGWLVARARWDVGDLYVEGNELAFSFQAQHLARSTHHDAYVPVDWIEIELQVPPFWERL